MTLFQNEASMKVLRQELEETIILSFPASVEIDIGNADNFKTLALEAIGDSKAVILDATMVEFFDSAGMGVLLALHKNVAENGGKFVLAAMSAPILEVFQMIGFDTIFTVYPDVPAAITGYTS
jgi:anti-sigma B factor antagonist